MSCMRWDCIRISKIKWELDYFSTCETIHSLLQQEMNWGKLYCSGKIQQIEKLSELNKNFAFVACVVLYYCNTIRTSEKMKMRKWDMKEVTVNNNRRKRRIIPDEIGQRWKTGIQLQLCRERKTLQIRATATLNCKWTDNLCTVSLSSWSGFNYVIIWFFLVISVSNETAEVKLKFNNPVTW